MPPSNNTSPSSSMPPQKGRLIGLETSGRQGSVSVWEVGPGEQPTILTHELPPLERSARSLAPSIQGLLSEIGWKPNTLDCVAIAIGPGSFTGLRVGVTTAKTLAYVAEAALVAVNTLDALAEPLWADEAPAGSALWAALDAQRSEVFAARYEGPPEPTSEETPVLRLTQADFFAQLKPGDRIVAPHAPLLRQRYEDAAGDEAGIDKTEVDWITAQPMADAVARLGKKKWQTGQLSDPFQLAPQYHRISAAEENLL